MTDFIIIITFLCSKPGGRGGHSPDRSSGIWA